MTGSVSRDRGFVGYSQGQDEMFSADSIVRRTVTDAREVRRAPMTDRAFLFANLRVAAVWR